VKKAVAEHTTAVKKAALTEAARQAFVERVRQLAEPLIEDGQMELVHVEYQREASGLTLRLYVDKPGGVRLDDCAAVSRQLSDLLDVHLDQDLPYNLEVSSPGANRPLGKPKDFERFKGHRAKIRLHQPRNGQRHFTGTIAGVDDTQVHLVLAGQTVAIAWEQITKAWLADPPASTAPALAGGLCAPRCDQTRSQGESPC